MNRQNFDPPSWYAVHTHPRQEDRAAGNLRAWGIETFSPKFKERHFNAYTQESTCLIKHLFPRYIFARFDLSRLCKVSYTRGIHAVVSFGDQPAIVEEPIIALIRSRIDGEGFVRIDDEPRPGDAVIVREGPLKGLTGVFSREMKEDERVMILLNAVNYQAHAVIHKSLVKRMF
jgi:transcriptional antiterminator RfaH